MARGFISRHSLKVACAESAEISGGGVPFSISRIAGRPTSAEPGRELSTSALGGGAVAALRPRLDQTLCSPPLT